MELELNKKELEEDISILKKRLKEKEKKLNCLKNLKEITTKYFYENISQIAILGFSFGEYEEVKTHPSNGQYYREKKEGKIVHVELKNNIYLSKKQKKILEDYIVESHGAELIRYKYE